jgi:hypothetical protein
VNDHFSIDLETLGTRYNAAILSIGVQQFDIDTGKLGETFYREIDLDSAIKAGKVTGSTLAWWAQQGDAAKRVFGDKNKSPLSVALDELRTWMLKKATKPKVWGNGSSFDISILEHAYDNGAVGLKEPWWYTNIRDMRTIMDYCLVKPKREGTHHNALDDAKYQAQCIAAAHQTITRNGVPSAWATEVKPATQMEINGRLVTLPGLPPLAASADDDL